MIIVIQAVGGGLQGSLNTVWAQGGLLYKKTTQFLYVLENQGRELEIASGRLRNGPGTAWAPGGSFANQKPSVLEHFGSPGWKPQISDRATPKLVCSYSGSWTLVCDSKAISFGLFMELQSQRWKSDPEHIRNNRGTA